MLRRRAAPRSVRLPASSGCHLAMNLLSEWVPSRGPSACEPSAIWPKRSGCLAAMTSPGPSALQTCVCQYVEAQDGREFSAAQAAIRRDQLEAMVLAELRQREGNKREQPPCFDAGKPAELRQREEKREQPPDAEQQEQPGPLQAWLSQKTDAELREMLDMINWMREKVQRDQLHEQRLLDAAAAPMPAAAGWQARSAPPLLPLPRQAARRSRPALAAGPRSAQQDRSATDIAHPWAPQEFGAYPARVLPLQQPHRPPPP